ncbi:MAG: hypothetical protein ACEPOW_14320 [Bacteroidales bacterium]
MRKLFKLFYVLIFVSITFAQENEKSEATWINKKFLENVVNLKSVYNALQNIDIVELQIPKSRNGGMIMGDFDYLDYDSLKQIDKNKYVFHNYNSDTLFFNGNYELVLYNKSLNRKLSFVKIKNLEKNLSSELLVGEYLNQDNAKVIFSANYFTINDETIKYEISKYFKFIEFDFIQLEDEERTIYAFTKSKDELKFYKTFETEEYVHLFKEERPFLILRRISE